MQRGQDPAREPDCVKRLPHRSHRSESLSIMVLVLSAAQCCQEKAVLLSYLRLTSAELLVRHCVGGGLGFLQLSLPLADLVRLSPLLVKPEEPLRRFFCCE